MERPPDGPWMPTGSTEYRGSLFGSMVLWVEEQRSEFRPIVTGYTPANWRIGKRWRRAKAKDVA